MDRGIDPGQPRLVVYFGILIFLSYLASSALQTAGQVVSAVAGNKFVLSLKRMVLTRLLKLPMEFFDKQRSGYLVGRIDEPDAIAVIFSPTIFQPLVAVIQAVGALVIMTSIGGSIILLLVPFLFVIFFMTRWMSNRLRASFTTVMDSSARTMGGLQEVVYGIADLKHYDPADRKLGETLAQYKDLADKRMKQSVFMSVSTNALGLLTSAFSVAVMIMVGIYVARGSLTFGDYTALTGYALKLLAPAQLFGNLSMSLQPALVAMRRLGIVLGTETENELWGHKKVESLQGRLQFHQVKFSYEGTDQPVLKGCDFAIAPGECVAITGKNGSGKTTILKLLLGSYHGYTGEIAVDGTNLREMDISSLRGRIGLVSQNAYFFTGSLLDNIRMADLDAPAGEVATAVRLSGCPQVFKDGLENIHIEENGKNLSGGQRQAAAIARCLLKKPDILLFDEATTYLDRDARQVVLHAIREVFPDKTRIIITHDPEIAQMADRILRIEEGAITENPKSGALSPKKEPVSSG